MQRYFVKDTPRLGRIILLLAALLWMGLVLYPHFLKLPLYDENIFMVEGLRTAAGELPYRDFFDFIGPGTFYLVAAVIKLFGPSLFALRGLSLLSLLICAGCVWLLGRPFLPRRWLVVLMAFFWVSLIPRAFQVQHHLFSMTLGLVSVTLLLRWFEDEKYLNEALSHTKTNEKLLALSGFFAGLSLLFTQSVGGPLIISESLFLVLYLRSCLGNFRQAIQKTGLGFLLVSGMPVFLTLLFFASQRALPHFGQATVHWIFSGQYQQATSLWYLGEGFIKLPVLQPDQALLFFLQACLPVLGLLWGGFLAVQWRSKIREISGEKSRAGQLSSRLSTGQWQFLLLFITGSVFFVSAFTYPNTVVVAYHGWIVYLLSAVALCSLLRKQPRYERWILAAVVLWMGILAIRQVNQSLAMIQGPRLLSYGTVESTLFSPAWLGVERAKKLNALVYEIHEKTGPDDFIFAYNVSPHFYLLTGRKNPTRYQLLIAGYNTADQFEEAARDLRVKNPRFVLYDGVDALWFAHDLRFAAYRGRDYHIHPVEAVLKERYFFRGYINEVGVYERRS